LHPGLVRSSNNAQVLSLIFKSLREDVAPKRAAAIVKRLLQVSSQAPATFACGSLMAISAFLVKQPSHWSAIRQPREADVDCVEHFTDAKSDGSDDERTGLFEGDDDAKTVAAATSKSDSDQSSDDEAEGDERKVAKASDRYDMEKREPLYARAETCCWWELTVLAASSHPSVSAMSKTLLEGNPIEYDGDPLADMTLTVFLDKWLQKKPKKKSKGGGSAIMRGADDATDGSFMPGTAEFASLTESEVDPSEVFFHRYFANKVEKAVAKKKKADKQTTEDEDSDEPESDDDGELPKKKFDDSESEGEESEDELDVEEINIDEASDSDEELTVPLKKIGKHEFKEESDEEAEREILKSELIEEGIDDDRFNLDALAKAYGKPPGYLLKESEAKEREAEDKAVKAIKRAVDEGPMETDGNDVSMEDFTNGDIFASADDYASMIDDDYKHAVDPSKLDDDEDADEDADIDVQDESDDDEEDADEEEDKDRPSSSKKSKKPSTKTKTKTKTPPKRARR